MFTADSPRHDVRPPRRTGIAGLVRGLAALAVLVGLGFAARTSVLTHADLAVDEHVAAGRDSLLTGLAKAATDAASPTVGVAVAVVVPALLLFFRRRWDALRVFCVTVGALAVAFVVKYLVAEPRPPQRLWVLPPDSRWSFPSGHATVASAIAVILLLLFRRHALRWVAGVVGVVFAVFVAWARVYLGVHYPADVLGGYLATITAFLLVMGLVEVPPVARLLAGLRRSSGPRHAARRRERNRVPR